MNKILTGIILAGSLNISLAEEQTLDYYVNKLEKIPHNAEADKYIGIAYYQKKDYKKANRYFEKALPSYNKDKKFMEFYLSSLFKDHQYVKFSENLETQISKSKYRMTMLLLVLNKRITFNQYTRLLK